MIIGIGILLVVLLMWSVGSQVMDPVSKEDMSAADFSCWNLALGLGFLAIFRFLGIYK